MSGQNAIKGYLFQSMIAVLNSFDKDWDEICVEPNTELDKIDIVWSGNQFSEVCQVKSSINNFSKNDILKWIEYLRLDNPNANKYIVCLIGSSDNATKQFFNAIDSKTVNDFPSGYVNLELIKDKIDVIFEPNNIATLENALISGVDKFFYSHNILADHPTKKLIANGMVNQIIKLSTSGTKMSKDDFEKHLLEWVTYNYSSQIKSKNATSFKLQFYKENQLALSESITKMPLADIKDLEIFTKKLNSLRQRFNVLSKYNFEVKSFEQPRLLGMPFSTFLFNDEYSGYENRQVIINYWSIDNIIKLSKRILGVEPNREFFNFGELKESCARNINILSPAKKTWKGSDEELEKHKLYNEFYWEIIELEDLMMFWKNVNKLSVLPIVLSNIGTQFEEDIKVHLLFPKSIKIYTAKNFPAPRRNQILSDVTADSSFFFNVIRHQKSRLVDEYSFVYKYPEFFFIPSLLGDSGTQDLKKYRRLLDYYFEYEFFDEKEHKVLEYNFDKLNTNAKIAFPAYLFIRSDMDFTIEYRITCKNNTEVITGKLNYLTAIGI